MFDTIFLIIVLALFVFGLLKGFLRELFPTVGLVGGYLAAGKFHLDYMSIVSHYVRNAAESKVITFIIILLLGFLAGIIVDSVIFMVFRRGAVGIKGRIAGGLLGATKGITILMVIFYIVRGYIPAFADELKASVLAPYLHQLWKSLHAYSLA